MTARGIGRRLAALEARIGAVGCCCRGLVLSLRTLVRSGDPHEQVAQYDAERMRPDHCPVHGEIRRTVVRLHGRRTDEEFDAAWHEFHERLRRDLQ